MKSQMQSPKPSFPRPRPRARSSAKASKTRTATINSSPSSSSSASCSSGSSAGSGSDSHIDTIAYAGTGTDVGGGTSNSNPSARLKNGNDNKVLQVQVHVDSSSHNKDGTGTAKQMKRRSRSKSKSKAKNMNTPVVASKSKVESESPSSSSPSNSPPMAIVDEHRDCSPTTVPMNENTENAMEKTHVTGTTSQSQTQHVKRSHTRKQMRKNKSKSQHQNQHSNQKSKKGQGLGQEQGVEQDPAMKELVPLGAVESESVSQPPESRPTHSKSDSVSKRGQSHHQHGKKYSRQGKQYHKRHGNGNTDGNGIGNDIDNLRKETQNIPENSPTDKSPAQDEHLDNHHVNAQKQNRRTGKKSKSHQQHHHRRSSSPNDVNVSLHDDGEGHGTCTMNANDAVNDLSIPKLDARSDASKSTMVVVPPPLFSPMQTRKVTDESSHVQQVEEATKKEKEGDEQKKEFQHTAQRTTDREQRGSSTGGSARAVNKTGSETVVTTNAAGLALLHRLSGHGACQPNNRNQGDSCATVVDVQHDHVIADTTTTRSAATSNLNDSISSSASGGVGASMEVHAGASPMHARDEEFEGDSFVGWKNGEEEQNFVYEDVHVEEYVNSTNPSMMYCEASEMPMPYMMHPQTMMNMYGPPHSGHPPLQSQQGWMNANVNPHLVAPTMQVHTGPAPVADGGSVGSEGHGQELHMSPPSYPYEHMDMTAIPQPQQPMYMTNGNYPVMIGNQQGHYVDGNEIPSYPPISPHHVGYGMNEPCPMPYGSAVPDAMQQQQPPLPPSSQPLQPIVPLKYEQVTIGGCMYFNPVYIADAEDLAPDDQDASGGDQDKENQAVDVNVSKNVGTSKKKGKANPSVTKQKNTRPSNKKVKRGGKGRNKGRFNKSHQNNDKRVANTTPS